jgi:aldehyde dehydrogenase family 7 protein A1
MRRIFLHESVYDKFVDRMTDAYKTIKHGNPLEDGVLLGPLHTKDAVKEYTEGIETIKK